MNKEQAAREIAALTKQINYYNEQFFQHHRSLISDYAFDQLVKKLQSLEAQYPELRESDSPTVRVGEKTSKAFPTVPHIYPMLSLDNTYAAEEVAQFDARVHKLLPEEEATYFCEVKLDGVAISLRYEKGKLAKVVTRGDGVQGDDITTNGRMIATIPHTLKGTHLPDIVEVRGELYMSKKAFKALNEAQKKAGNPLFANPRNTAAGTIKTLDSSVVAQRNLSFCPYTLLGDFPAADTQEKRIHLLQKWGFALSQTYRMCKNLTEVIDYIHDTERQRETLPMEIDGVVIKVNEIPSQEKLGSTSKSPRWAIAYKYKPENATALLEDIIYQVGRTGSITPVAKLTPTLLAGSTIQRASLHNAHEIEALDLHLHDTVYIEKGGDVIPKITGVDVKKRKKNSNPIQFITRCPSCDTELVKIADEANHYCPNERACPWQLKAKLYHFVQRKAMHISHIGGKTIDLLFEKKIIQRPADLYKLRIQDFAGLDGFQAKSVNNILTSIEASTQQPFAKVLFALGIRYVGETVARRLVQELPTLNELKKASKETLMEIPEIGEQIADSIVAYFKAPYEISHLQELEAAGVQLAYTPEKKEPTNQALAGKRFVITGTYADFSREKMRDYIRIHGGRVVSALSSQVDYLVAGSNAGPAKTAKAKKLEVAIISEEALKELVADQ